MFHDLHLSVFQDFADSAERKLDLMWPPRDKTNPIEVNIIVNLAEVASHYGYLSVAEFPTRNNARHWPLSPQRSCST